MGAGRGALLLVQTDMRCSTQESRWSLSLTPVLVWTLIDQYRIFDDIFVDVGSIGGSLTKMVTYAGSHLVISLCRKTKVQELILNFIFNYSYPYYGVIMNNSCILLLFSSKCILILSVYLFFYCTIGYCLVFSLKLFITTGMYYYHPSALYHNYK